MNTEEIRKEVIDNALDFEAFKQMALGKLSIGELTSETLNNLLDQIYWIGRFTGRLEQQYYQD